MAEHICGDDCPLCFPPYILYRGSRDELNELCRQKDAELTALRSQVETLRGALEKIAALADTSERDGSLDPFQQLANEGIRIGRKEAAAIARSVLKETAE